MKKFLKITPINKFAKNHEPIIVKERKNMYELHLLFSSVGPLSGKSLFAAIARISDHLSYVETTNKVKKECPIVSKWFK